jgi:hypothetical protein
MAFDPAERSASVPTTTGRRVSRAVLDMKLVFPRGMHPWTVDGRSSKVERDPVNVVVANSDGDKIVATMARAGLHPVHWLERLARPQWFRHVDNIHQSDDSLGSSRELWPLGRRVHTRVYSPGSGSPDPELGEYSVATAHLDRIALSLSCGTTPEVSSSFTLPREYLARRLAEAGLNVEIVRTRNVGSARQCDGTRVVADGRVTFVR